jgi:hypothetical protein
MLIPLKKGTAEMDMTILPTAYTTERIKIVLKKQQKG